MKILLIHNFYRQDKIGGEDIVFKKQINDLTLLLGKSNVFIYKAYTDDANIFYLLKNVLFSFKHFISIYFLIKNEKIDITHCHNIFPMLSPSVLFASKIAGAINIITLHNYRFWCVNGKFYRNNSICTQCLNNNFPISGIFYSCYMGSKKNSIVATFAFWFYKKIKTFKHIDYFIVLTNFQKEFLINKKLINAKKIVVIPNYIKILDNDFSQEKKLYDFVFVGKLEESKGLKYLINIVENYPNLKILIIGFADDEVINLFTTFSNVIYYKSLPNLETLKLIRKSKFLLQLSLWFETFGLTIIESFSVGTPVIGFNIGTRLDLIKNNFNGFLLNNNTLINDLNKILCISDIEYNKISKNCFIYSKKFEDSLILNNQIAFYNSIMHEKKI